MKNMEILKKKWLVLILWVLLCAIGVTRAQTIDSGIQSKCNDMIEMIFDEIMEKKAEYPDLKLFTKLALSKNQYGIDEIKYLYKDPLRKTIGNDLEFAVKVIGVNDTNDYSAQQGSFNYPLPVLGLKIVGYQNESNKSRQFNLQEIVDRQSQSIINFQSQQLPILLSISTSKMEYAKDENIIFTIMLTNTSSKNLRVYELSSKSLYFVYDKTEWGTANNEYIEYDKLEKKVLHRNESIKKTFAGAGFANPKEVLIYCSYNMQFDGVKPSASIKVNVK